jgi:hypothetical protein
VGVEWQGIIVIYWNRTTRLDHDWMVGPIKGRGCGPLFLHCAQAVASAREGRGTWARENEPIPVRDLQCSLPMQKSEVSSLHTLLGCGEETTDEAPPRTTNLHHYCGRKHLRLFCRDGQPRSKTEPSSLS